MPGPFGHEYSGTVESVGDEVENFQQGQDVMGVHSGPCFDCYWCKRGQQNLCQEVMRTKVLGAFSEYLLLPSNVVRANLYSKPDEISFERAAMLEPLACVASGLSRLNPNPDDSVLLVGSGAIAVLFQSALNRIGVKNCWIVGRNQKRTNWLKSNGYKAIEIGEIPEIIRTNTDNRGFDVSIECAGNTDAWQTALQTVRRGGTLMLFGGCPKGSVFQVDTSRLHYDDLTIMSPFHFGTKDVLSAKEMLCDDNFRIGPLISGEAKLDDAREVFEDLRLGQAIKIAFVP